MNQPQPRQAYGSTGRQQDRPPPQIIVTSTDGIGNSNHIDQIPTSQMPWVTQQLQLHPPHEQYTPAAMGGYHDAIPQSYRDYDDPHKHTLQYQSEEYEVLIDDIDRPAYAGSASSQILNEDDVSILCLVHACINAILRAEHLQRALCFGAIDGMVTGAGITAACAGLGLFHPFYTPLQQRLTILGLSLAACASDGLCMGIGHIWSSYVLQERSTKEHQREQWMFVNYRSVSKAKLVDMLLRRGMLKIDAMSVADTLEGYPDMFVSALVGDSQGAGPIGLGGEEALHAQDSFPEGTDEYRGLRTSPYLTYDDIEEGEGTCCSSSILSECWSEGSVMMLSFSLFSLLPGFMYGFVPLMIHPDMANLQPNGDFVRYDTGMSCASLAMTALSIIILLLGVWKSKFFGAGWITFGIEAVFVLMICMLSAYGLGMGISHVLGTQKTLAFHSNY